MTVRLYLDEDVTQALARALRARGMDATSAHEVGNEGLDDEQQLAYAAGEERAVVTSNHHDFALIARKWAGEGRSHAGTIILHQQVSVDSVGAVTERLIDVLGLVSEQGIANITLVV